MRLKKQVIQAVLLGLLSVPFSVNIAGAAAIDGAAGTYSLDLDAGDYVIKTMLVNGKEVTFRAYEDRVYVQKPVDVKYEKINIYVPEAYYEGQQINGYTADSAPIFLPNTVGGYMPGEPGVPGQDRRHGEPDAALTALAKGYVVAEPGARGRTLQDMEGAYTGKAPACIVDLKAAVRYLRHNRAVMPGNTEKIISNGTSAGGALSALLGASGNSKDYEPYLKELGAAEERDDIFAVSAYCPITNLEHADMAYEWLFNGVDEYHQQKMGVMPPLGGANPAGPMPADLNGARPLNAPLETGTASTLSEQQITASTELKAMFPAYLNRLGLKDASGTPLMLDRNGNGTFKQYIESYLLASAQTALDAGQDLSKLDWLTVADGKAVQMDMDKYVVFATRLKAVPAFDGFDLATGENSLFGTKAVDAQHFTDYSLEHGSKRVLADEKIIKMMNPMNYIVDAKAVAARHWRIRHGAVDRDTSLAVPAILATKLMNAGFDVDFAMPWGQGHGGDYDLEQLFAWMDGVVKAGKK